MCETCVDEVDTRRVSDGKQIHGLTVQQKRFPVAFPDSQLSHSCFKARSKMGLIEYFSLIERSLRST